MFTLRLSGIKNISHLVDKLANCDRPGNGCVKVTSGLNAASRQNDFPLTKGEAAGLGGCPGEATGWGETTPSRSLRDRCPPLKL